jgi:hypothetical protein
VVRSVPSGNPYFNKSSIEAGFGAGAGAVETSKGVVASKAKIKEPTMVIEERRELGVENVKERSKERRRTACENELGTLSDVS